MRMTKTKKFILASLAKGSWERKTQGFDDDPLDVYQISEIIFGPTFSKSQLWSTRRTIETMVQQNLLEKIMVVEDRKCKGDLGRRSGSTIAAFVCRYSLPGDMDDFAVRNQTNRAITYIVKNELTHAVKIGKTTNLSQRLSSLSSACGSDLTLIAAVPDDIEKELHNRFSEQRGIGEWFRDDDGAIERFANKLSETYMAHI